MANAFRYYVGTDGDWSQANNWSATRGGAGGAGVPGADDKVFVEDLNHALDTGLSQGAVDLQSLTITVAPGGSVGGAGNILDIDVSSVVTTSATTLIHVFGGGTVYLAGNHDAATIISNGDVYLGGATSTCGSVRCGQTGRIIITDGTATTTFVTTGMSTDLRAGTGAQAQMNFLAGSHLLDRDVTITNVYGNARVRSINDTAPGTVTVYPNARYTHNSSGTITRLYVLTGATATAAGAHAPFQVTDSDLYAGGKMFEQSPVIIDINGLGASSNATTYYGFPGFG